MRRIAVIGLGNPLLSDEGIGIRVVETIKRRRLLTGQVDVLDMGTGGLRLLHEMRDRKKVVFVDCAFMGETPGTLRRFTPEEVATQKVQPRLSLHEGDLLQTLALAERMESYPHEVVIFGIQPAEVQMGTDLSATLWGRVSGYADTVAHEVRTTRHA